jgi:hypothetical protein
VSHQPPRARRVHTFALALIALALLAGACGDDDTGEEAVPTVSSDDDAMSDDTGDMAMTEGSDDMAMDDGDSMGDDIGDMAMMMQTVASESWDGMRIELAAMAPTTFTLFQGVDETLVEPDERDSVHLMAVLADEQSGERIPYADVWVTLRDSDGSIVFDERMWPMLSRAMGTHYGINVALPGAGTYEVELQVGAPQGARHPEYSDRWLDPTSFTMTYSWDG